MLIRKWFALPCTLRRRIRNRFSPWQNHPPNIGPIQLFWGPGMMGQWRADRMGPCLTAAPDRYVNRYSFITWYLYAHMNNNTKCSTYFALNKRPFKIVIEPKHRWSKCPSPKLIRSIHISLLLFYFINLKVEMELFFFYLKKKKKKEKKSRRYVSQEK